MNKAKLTDQIEVITAIDKCAGHMQCQAAAPNIYALSEGGFNTVPARKISRSLTEAAIRGARACPERIIVVKELKK